MMNDLVRQHLLTSMATMQRLADDAEAHQSLMTAAGWTADALRKGGKLMIAGNGGSAADAQHLAAEFVVRLTINRPALRAVALTTDGSILTAVGNDLGYEHVFSRQVEALGEPGDVLLGISTSGNSKNLMLALETARSMGMKTFGLLGKDGGSMRALCDACIVVPAQETARVQEAHLALEHIFCTVVERLVFGMEMFA